MKALENLVHVTQRIGGRSPGWVQGAGGNSSFKSGNGVLIIKPSGARMSDMQDLAHFAEVDIEKFLDRLGQAKKNMDESLYAHALQSSNLSHQRNIRPSMETGFHAVLPKQWVLHFHSLVAILMGWEHSKNPKKVEQWLTRHWEEAHQIIGLCSPGLELTFEVQKHNSATLFVLKNHGVILQGNDESCLDRWESIEDRFCVDWKYDKLSEGMKNINSEVLWREKWALKAIPMKYYFPDMAVFAQKIEPLLEKQKDQEFLLKKDAWVTNPGLGEIWLATQILYSINSQLSELPGDMISKIQGLPTEKHRVSTQK
ncbi:MAG: hypothetical protein KCHDKBKB_00455 [Elusimicrobia bacterium]|nr:hypothetical protein [Elusimicrobiota bacterium]